MRQAYVEKRKAFPHSFLFSLILSMLILTGLPTIGIAHAMGYRSLASCPSVGNITSNSLLVVLLDRSGSLIQEPGATDPKGYATSVTKALADLWPGRMAVIPFNGDTTSLPVFGPAQLSDPAQLANLKSQVENYQIGGDTPLGPAMHEALTQLQGAAQGSRVIVITDGNPTGIGDNDGSHQEDDIRRNLVPQFCKQGLPVSAFGLTIDPKTSDGQDASHLLSDLTSGTGATYTNVRSPEELANAVISLYAQWQHLNFTRETAQGNNFPVSIDSFAQQANIVTFRSDSNYAITLDAPDGHLITQGVQQSTDRHYEIVGMNVAGPIIAGTYNVNTSNDPDAQVYALVKSSLQVQINAPTSQTMAYTGRPVPIESVLLNGNNLLTPQNGQAQLIAHVKLLINGQQVGATNDVVLVQQGAYFRGQTLAYPQIGEMVIDVSGNYQQVQREVSVNLQLHLPPKVILPPQPSICRLGFWSCLWQQHSQQIVTFGPLALLLLLLLLRLLQPAPYGVLEKGGYVYPLGRPFLARLFSSSLIRSNQLAAAFDLRGGQFNLTFGGGAHIKAKSDMPPIKVIHSGNQVESVQSSNKAGVALSDGAVINIDGKDVATFLSHDPANELDEFH